LDYHSVFNFTTHLHFALLSIQIADSAILIFLALFLFIISFLVAGSEVAFFSLTYKDINLLKTKQLPAYKRIITLLEQPKTLLASIMIANNLVNIAIILILNILLTGWLSAFVIPFWVSFAIKIVIVTVILVLFGEVLPRVWATNHKIWFAAASSLVIEIFNGIVIRLSKRFVSFGDRIERNFSGKNSTAMDDSQLDYAIDRLPENAATIEEKTNIKRYQKIWRHNC